jgi:hypothetical protein
MFIGSNLAAFWSTYEEGIPEEPAPFAPPFSDCPISPHGLHAMCTFLRLLTISVRALR